MSPSFNSLLEMLLHRLVRHQRRGGEGFQFSIGDARHSPLKPKRQTKFRFQFSIGDAGRCGDRLQHRYSYTVSILYWRCKTYVAIFIRPETRSMCFNSLLEMRYQLHYGDSRRICDVSILYWRCVKSVARDDPYPHVVLLFQFSIGDAASLAFSSTLPSSYHVVSILYWRCPRQLNRPAPVRARRPVSILYWRCPLEVAPLYTVPAPLQVSILYWRCRPGRFNASVVS